MRTKIIIISFIISIILLFWRYFQIKEEIYYVETESLLYKYYYDYYYAHNKTFSLDNFLIIVSQKDSRLYKLLKDNKIVYYQDKEGFAYKRYQFSNNFVYSNDFTFFKFLFSTVSIGIDNLGILSKIDYEPEVIYQYKNHSFIEKEIFNKYTLRNEYAALLNCPKNKVIGNENTKALVLIQPQKVSFIKSEFDKESEAVIRKTLEETYRSKDTIMINLRFYNIKEAKCLDEL